MSYNTIDTFTMLYEHEPGTNHVSGSELAFSYSRRKIGAGHQLTYVRSPPCGRLLKIAVSPSLTYIAAKNLFGIMSHFWYHGPEFYGTDFVTLKPRGRIEARKKHCH